MRKVVLIVLALVAVVAAVLLIRSCGDSDGGYKVRAVFDNGGFTVTGVDVRVAGANVGSVSDVEVSMPGERVSEEPGEEDRPGKAIVVLNISDSDFQDFREDASCIIRPQSLIGEKFIDCQVTQPRPPGTEPPPPLNEVPDGEPGAGQYLLPLENNGKAVDQDLITNIYRLPYAQRFRIILNELGVGLATRGPELRETITRANPTLLEVNRVLKILSSQNRRLAQLARNSDNNLTQLAEKRTNLVGFFREAGFTAGATAERSEDMRENLRLLPTTLRELRQTFRSLEDFAGAARPTFEALEPNARVISEVTTKLAPFAEATEISLTSLGEATRTAGPDLVASRPIIRKLGTQARTGRQPFTQLNFFLGSTRKADGFRNLMRFFYNTASSLSGFDQFGHYQRTNVIITGCTEYKLAVFSNCSANWDASRASLAAAVEDALPEIIDGSGGIEPGDIVDPEGATGEDGATGTTGATGDEGEEPAEPVDPLEGDSLNDPAAPSAPGQSVAPSGTADPAGSSATTRSTAYADRTRSQLKILDYLLGN
jgi:phospholipid/cholesterol/gamma-HCH transport system substrate-binding protein